MAVLEGIVATANKAVREHAEHLLEWPTVPTTDPALALWFTPDCIREHFSDEGSELGAVIAEASDEELVEIGKAALNGDGLYYEFHRQLERAARATLLPATAS